MNLKHKQPRILMYHSIVSRHSTRPPDREVGAEIYDLTVDQFALQMEYLRTHGYNVITIDGTKKEYDEKDVVITLNDGEYNNFEYAFPVLKQMGMKAIFFVTVKSVGVEGYMRIAELKTLIDAGMTIGSQGLSREGKLHLLDTQIEEELGASKKFLERNLDVPIHDFSVPRGIANDKVIRMAYDAGYKNVFVAHRPRRVHEPCLSCIVVRWHWTLDRFEQGLHGHVPLWEKLGSQCKRAVKFVLREGGYNWVRDLIIKIIK